MTSSEEILKVQDTAQHGALMFCSFVLFLHGAGLGAGLGYSGLVLPHHVRNDTDMVYLTTEESTWFVGSTPIAMTVGVIMSIPISEKIGRKKLFLIGNVFSIMGYCILYFAGSLAVLVAGRTVQCVGMGLGAMTIGVFLSEISTVKMRGPLIGISQTSNCVGLLIGTATCIFLPIQYLSISLAFYSILIIILLCFIPRSPQWLMRNDKEIEACQSLKMLRGNKYPGVDIEIEEIKKCIDNAESSKNGSITNSTNKRTFTIPFLIFTVLFIVLGSCGNDTFVFYGPTIFSTIDIGVPTSVLATLPWIGYSIGYAASSPLMAKMNRKPQFIIFASIMSVSLFLFGTILHLINKDKSNLLQVMLIVSLQLGTVAYGGGVGSVAYTMTGEVFTPEYKTVGACLVQSVRCVTVFIFIKVTPSLISYVGLQGLFYIHGCVLIFAVLFAWTFLPETKGKTLTELCSIYEK